MIVFRQTSAGDFELDKQSLKSVITPNDAIFRMINSDDVNFSHRDDLRGANQKFWIKNDTVPEGLLFKWSRLRDSNSEQRASYYGELVVDLIAYHTGLAHTGYYPCRFIMLDGSVLEGTISPSYKPPQHVEFSAENITTRYKQSQYDNNNGEIPHIEYNTVYEYIKQLRFLYPYRIDESKAQSLKTYLLKIALLDYVTLQTDRHWGNFGWISDQNIGIKSIENIPLFDNECSFTFDRNIEKVQAFADSLVSMKNAYKKYVVPMAFSKQNAPLLGIKTSIIDLENIKRMVPRKFKQGEKSNYDMFLQELSEEIKNNQALAVFYQQLKELPLEQLMTSAKYFPNCITDTASVLMKARIERLEQELKKERSDPDDENYPKA